MILALIGALVVGVCLGLLGSGGSVLTVPILVYFLKRPEKLAIVESLFIVGAISFAGAVLYIFKKRVDWKTVVFFGIPGMLGSYLGACCSEFINGNFQLILFSCTMFAASWMMFRLSPNELIPALLPDFSFLIVLQGIFVGAITGLLGCGGGFIIVPSLVFLRQLPMFQAIATSLVLITINSFTGFFKQITFINAQHLSVNWMVIFVFSIIGIIGSLAGSFFSEKIPQARLKRYFAVSIFFMACFILVQQIYQLLFLT